MNEKTKIAITYMLTGVLFTFGICFAIFSGITYGFDFVKIALIVVGVLGYAVAIGARFHDAYFED